MSKLANRYAIALFDVAMENNSSAQVYQDLKDAYAILSDPEILTYFKARDVDRQDKIKVLNQSFKGSNQEILGLLKLLVKNHRFMIYPDILKAYEQIYYRHENIKIADITSAIELTQEQVEQLKQTLEKKYQAQIDMRIKINPDLLQGLVIKIEDEILDNSLKSKFDQLQKHLLSKGRQHGH